MQKTFDNICFGGKINANISNAKNMLLCSFCVNSFMFIVSNTTPTQTSTAYSSLITTVGNIVTSPDIATTKGIYVIYLVFRQFSALCFLD